MNKLSKITVKLVAAAQILAITLAACTSGASANVCHATGDAVNPYEEITIDSTESGNEHLGHSSDIFPVPVSGCPTSPVVIIDGKITICHATRSETNPYEEITVSVNGLNGHGRHEGDIIPVSEDDCPTSPAANNGGMVTICHATGSEKNPYIQITISVNGLNGHDKHEGDIIPMPQDGCPTTKP
jgi:hypothetical protein